MTGSESDPAGAAGSDVDIVALRPGARIGRHEVLEVLGQGGFGITYRARDGQLNREVAIKEYLPVSLAHRTGGTTVLPRSTRVADDFAWGRERFVAEGQTLAGLHRAPGIVHVFDFLETNGTAYIVMELLHGDTLEGRLSKGGRLDAAAIDRILWPLLDGLEQVHAAGFLHRDIKPANILLDRQGHPTLIDFGASRAAMAGRTQAMTAIFTPGYAAAEQMTSARQGPWTDIYSLAATLHHAIAGRTPPNAFDRLLDDRYEPLARIAPPGFAPGLFAGIDRGLAVQAADRPQSIAEWRRLLTGAPAPAGDTAVTVVLPRTPSLPPPALSQPPAPAPGRDRRPLLAGIAAGTLLLAAGGAWFALSPSGAPAPVPEQTAALGDMKVEDLERALAERRAADAAAAEKKRLEEEARRQAETEAAAKLAADTELEKAEAARRTAEDELARLRATIDARRQADMQAEAQARRAEAEAAQQRAEAEMARLLQAEEEARRRADLEAEAKRQADEAIAKAQAERQRADEEATEKAATEAKVRADAASAESGLRLGPSDRQRAQVALSSLGFDTKGSDGAFGPRTREAIAAWQTARNLTSTGFLTGTHLQALLREAAPALQILDDEQAAKKKNEEQRARTAGEAKPTIPPAASPPAIAVAAATVQPAAPVDTTAYDGRWSGTVDIMARGHAVPVATTIRNGVGTSSWRNQRCNGDVTFRINIQSGGTFTIELAGYNQNCAPTTGTLNGTVRNDNSITVAFGQVGRMDLRR